MFNSIREELESTVTPLLRDIFEDARSLLQQEAQLLKAEVREDGAKVRQAMTYIIAGSVSIAISVLLCAYMLVQVLATEWLKVPLWVSFGLVAIAMAVCGGIFSYIGGKKLEAVKESSERSIRAFKEGFGWMQRPM
jgi:hypothetical protein